jgi:hypothetical protein
MTISGAMFLLIANSFIHVKLLTIMADNDFQRKKWRDVFEYANYN